MPFVNDGYGCVYQTSDPGRGVAELYWRPLHRIHDNADATGALPPGWNAGKPDWQYRRLARITAKTWQNDAKPPFSWLVNVMPARSWFGWLLGDYVNLASTIHLFVAPHVELETFDVDPGFYFAEPDLIVVRLDSSGEVPLPGREANLADLIGERPLLEYFSGTLQTADVSGDGRGQIAISSPTTLAGGIDARMLPSIHITREAKRFVIERKSQYRIEINLSETEPSFFRIAIADPNRGPMGRDIPGLPPQWDDHQTIKGARDPNETCYRIIHSPNVTIGFTMAASRRVLKTDPRTARVETRVVRRDAKLGAPMLLPLQTAMSRIEAAVIVSDNYSDLSDPDRAVTMLDFYSPNWDTIEPEPFEGDIDSLFQMGIGFIPVLGQLYDVADIISIAVTGRDLMGAKASKTDIALIAAFSLFGVLGDAARTVDLGQATRIAQHLFPGAKIVSLNPNFVRTFVRAIMDGSPALRHAAAGLADEIGPQTLRDMDRLMLAAQQKGLDDATRAGIEAELATLATTFNEAISNRMIRNARDIPFDRQPATLDLLRSYQAQFRVVLAGIEDLDIEVIDAVLVRWDEAHALDQLDSLLAAIDEVNARAGKALRDAICERIAEDVNNDPVIWRRAAAYFAGHGKPYTPLGYLVNIAGPGTEAREVFDLKYGRAAFDLIKGRTRPDIDQLIAEFEPQIRELIYDRRTYYQHRELIRQFPGLGYILNSDHLLEARFRKVARNGGSIDPGAFLAMLVPPNAETAEKLARRGIQLGWYVHQAKTARINELLPQRVADYEIQEIADAYQLFWVHEQGMDPGVFSELFEQEFYNLSRARNGERVGYGEMPVISSTSFTLPKSRAALVSSLDLLKLRMALPDVVLAEVGSRISNGAGL